MLLVTLWQGCLDVARANLASSSPLLSSRWHRPRLTLFRSFCSYSDLLSPSYVSVTAGCERGRLRDGAGKRRQLCAFSNAVENSERSWATTTDVLRVDDQS